MFQDQPWLAALLFIVLIVGANAVMYVIARGAQRDNKNSTWFQSLNKTAKNPWEKEDKSLEELSKRVKDLQARSKDDEK